jgi:hypothetical protein
VDAYASKYFTPQGRIVTTLWHDQAAATAAPEVK